MGKLFRRYWIPALLSEEIPAADGAPVRVRLLGEDLVAFRDTEGKTALVGAYCPHRRAPLFFGRNEECGLRCVYHGWKFDREGACVDMPSEQCHPERSRGTPDSLFKTKVRVEAYPTWEGGGMIWTYMGPPELQPPPPDHELVRAPATHAYVGKSHEDCNFLQALEGGIDPTHAGIMHNSNIGDMRFLYDYEKLVAGIELEKTDYGFKYAGLRYHPDFVWVRGYHWIMPSFHMRGKDDGLFRAARKNEIDIPSVDGHIWIPIDDEQTFVFSFQYSIDPAVPLPREQWLESENRLGRGTNLGPGYIPKANRSNDYLIDRELQKTKTMTGIRGINTQDFALQEGMGKISDRSKEHLGTTDRAIITLRQMLLEQLTAMEEGKPLRGLDPATYRNVRAIDRRVPKDRDWREATQEHALSRF